MLLQAIVFDFDGVIADTEPLHLMALQQALHCRGIPLARDEYYDRYLGYDDATLVDQLLRDRGRGMPLQERRAVVADKARRYSALVADRPPILPGVIDRLRRWSAQVPIAIASGALRVEIDGIMASAGVSSCVAAIVAAGDVPRGKPAADAYRRAVELLDVAPISSVAGRSPIVAARAVAIEDSRWGIESARAAGLRVVAVTTSYRQPDLAGADLVVGGVADLELADLERLVSSVAPARPAGR